MEGPGSYDKLDFDGCQIQDTAGGARIGSWGYGGTYYSIFFQLGCIFVSNLSQNENNSMLIYRLHNHLVIIKKVKLKKTSIIKHVWLYLHVYILQESHNNQDFQQRIRLIFSVCII